MCQKWSSPVGDREVISLCLEGWLQKDYVCQKWSPVGDREVISLCLEGWLHKDYVSEVVSFRKQGGDLPVFRGVVIEGLCCIHSHSPQNVKKKLLRAALYIGPQLYSTSVLLNISPTLEYFK